MIRGEEPVPMDTATAVAGLEGAEMTLGDEGGDLSVLLHIFWIISLSLSVSLCRLERSVLLDLVQLQAIDSSYFYSN